MAISDGVVIGIVLGLIFAAVSYYLFTRQTQLEKKVGLMENILLDLRVTTEQALVSATESHDIEHSNDLSTYKEYASVEESSDFANKEVERPASPKETQQIVEESVSRDHSTAEDKEHTAVSNNYESMTYKELTQIARQKGISGLRNMSKAQVIDALRALEGGSSAQQTSGTPVPLSAWMTDETDSKLQSEDLSSASDGLGQHFSTFNDDAVEVSLVSSD
jgi:hypothetical protein